MSTIYLVKSYYDETFLADVANDFTDLRTLERVIAELEATAKRMRYDHLSQYDVKFDARQRLIERVSNEGEWKFAVDDELRNSGPCVYFIQNPRRMDIIKIGRSKDLWQRAKAHQWKLNGRQEALILIGYVKTPSYIVYEEALHQIFEDYRVEGEWFQAEPVIEFVDAHRR